MDCLLSPYNMKNVSQNAKKIIVYDTTLRDGEQMPGVAFSPEAKLEIAHALADAGIKEIEAGYPAVSDEEIETIKRIKETTDAKILGLSRCRKEDIEACAAAGIDLVLLFIATSEIHLKYKLKMEETDVIKSVADSIEFGKSMGMKMCFSTEDTTRTDKRFLDKIYSTAIQYGVERIGITDTVGCAAPEAIKYLTAELKKKIRVPISVHLHNDFGLACANALAALDTGADAFAVTVMGIGERAGNLSLEQFVMAAKYLRGIETDIAIEKLPGLVEMVARYAKLPVPKNQPWVGENIFTHESGIHAIAVLANPFTYECVSPGVLNRKRRILLGKHSGKGVISAKLAAHGIPATPEEIEKIQKEVKKLGSMKGFVDDDEFLEIVNRIKHGAR